MSWMAFGLKCVFCLKTSLKVASCVSPLNLPYQHPPSQKILSGIPPLIRDEIPVSVCSLRNLSEHKYVFSETENYTGKTKTSSKSVLNFSPKLLALIFSWTFLSLNSHLLLLILLAFFFIKVFCFSYFSLIIFLLYSKFRLHEISVIRCITK